MELTPLLGAALPLALFIIMLSMGMTLERSDFVRVATHGKAFWIGLSSQMLVPPLLAIALVWIFSLPPALAVGLLVLSLCPSGTTSNLFSYLARADVALSISLTAVASLITPFTVPLFTELVLLWQYGTQQSVSLPVLETMIKLLLIVLLPVVMGMLWRIHGPTSCARWQSLLHRFSVLLFAAVIVGIVVDQGAQLADTIATAGTVCMVLVVLAMLSGWYLARYARLPERQVKTVSIEVGLQHGGMALVVTQGVLHNSEMSIIPLTYGLLMLIPVIMLVAFTRRSTLEAGENTV